MNNVSIAKLKKCFKAVLPLLAVVLGVMIFSKLALYLLPFILAFTLSAIIDPMIGMFKNKFRIPRKLSSALSILILLSVFSLLAVLAISRFIREMINLSLLLPNYVSEGVQQIDSLMKKGSEFYLSLPVDVSKSVESFFASLSANLMKFVNTFIKFILNAAVSIPQVMIFIIVTVLSTFFLSSDKENISNYFKSKLSDKLIRKITSIKSQLFSALFGYLKAQLILMAVTFSELFTGFIIIHIGQPFILAIIISMIDALPILGTGSVLIPWLLYEFLAGNTRLGISLLILYIIVLIVRQLIEPKILSYQIGVHPLLTLIGMYIGLKLFGILGLMLGPICVLFIKNILSGVFKNNTLKNTFHKKRFSP